MNDNSIPAGRKKFDLEAFKNGAKAVSRNGTAVKFIAHLPDAPVGERLIVQVLDGKRASALLYENGKYLEDTPHGLDLFMVVEKKTGWVNIALRPGSYKPGAMPQIFPTKVAATCARMAVSIRHERFLGDPVEISWTE
jgi:hypothetical protein